ncbi:MAG: hypothetical protein H0U56_06375 [Methylibium sp.]|uniref:hypothetical protein n=1 Tax=Methylibium sp. TaxID=2067992 RepID=UPI0017E670A6|nr:hypothetical protein [Methylibium sp.]MBA2722516.1 hypothetical protein [Methylibium sp.]MBA3589065.1 hypothetical protein [Methylibium sp.]
MTNATAPIDIASLHPPHRSFALLGRIDRCKLSWAGQLACSVQTSVGPLQVRGNRDVLLDVREGSWLALQLQRDEFGVHVRAVQAASPLSHAAWLASVPCDQPAVVQRLRVVLARLSPGAQALFMSVLSGGHTQLRFFRRAAAADHHAAPGGLFKQSVHAAELAYAAWHPSEPERDTATLAALLFDIGKLADPHVGWDLPREGPDLEPHFLTRLRALPACDLVERHEPALARAVRSLLVPAADEEADSRLRQSVHLAVTRSWSTDARANQGTQ